MLQGKALQINVEAWERRAVEIVGRHWKWIVLAAWLVACAWFMIEKWSSIRFFFLPDTDDNMRLMQVRGLLHGQGWFELRQYRMKPPWGANIHWSRLVDRPIAGLILGLRPLLGGPAAERWAVAIAPLLPYLLLLFSLALTARRLIDPRAYPLALLAIVFAGSTNGMCMPERIDHHGWQLALLAASLAGVADPRRVRGGLVLGATTALSFAIGLEMVIYLALAGAAMVLFWVADAKEAARLRAYALSLSAGIALAFLIFASNDNRNPVCDALSPVYLSDALLAGGLMYALTWFSPRGGWTRRFWLALIAGLMLAGFHASFWPQCLEKPEHISPEAQRLWMSYVKEARPVFLHGWRTASMIAALPITGAIGWALLAWMRRRDPDLLRRIIGVAVPGIVASLLLLWQTRTGPAAQMMAVVGASAIVWFLFPLFWGSRHWAVRVGGAVVAIVVGVGAAVPLLLGLIPEKNAAPARGAAIGRANNLCSSLWGLHPIALQPKGLVFTFVDLGPRLITLTHHDVITGPYHRNYRQIVDVMHAWRGSAEQAHQIIVGKYHSDYVLSCPNSSTTTIFMSEAPKGFYGQLARGKVPKWLQPVHLPSDSPFKMWRVVG
jgi:hypothetical protein